MFNKSKYGNILKVILFIVVISIIGIAVLVGYKSYNEYYINTGAKEAVRQFEETVKNNTTDSKITTLYKEYNVIGTIQIPEVDLKYPILQENTPEALETSVVLLYTAQGLNNSGNTVIIGHNYRNSTMFSNLKKLIKGNDIYITDSLGRTEKYRIYDIQTVQEGDNSYITRNIDNKEICLSTSADDSKAKIVVFAKEAE